MQLPNLLRTPGPSPIPPSVQQAMNTPMISHRTEEAEALFQNVRRKLGAVFGTDQEVIILAGSGTSGLEAAVVNIATKGDEVLLLITGEFGQQFANICEAYGLVVHRIDYTWGEAVSLEQVKDKLQENQNIKAVFATQSETSTGVLNPIAEISNIVHTYSEALMIVDGVSSVGGADAQLDKWGVDIFVTGSQKAMMLPPGLAFLAISERAWDVIRANKQGRYYLDLLILKDFIMKNSTPHTPAVSLIYGLDEVLNLIHKEGVQNVYNRHTLMMNMFRGAMKALHVPLLASDEDASPTVTAIVPENVEAEKLRLYLKDEFGLDFAGGLKHLAGKIIRVGHMGYCFPSDVLQMVSLLEVGLHRMGANIELGQGTKAAQEIYLQQAPNLVK